MFLCHYDVLTKNLCLDTSPHLWLDGPGDAVLAHPLERYFYRELSNLPYNGVAKALDQREVEMK